MAEIQNTQKKCILADPVMQFKKICPDATEKQLTTLIIFEQQYVELKKQLKEKQNHCKKISRQIGDAKREGRPAKKIMQTMQQQSADIDNLKKQLNDISDSILHCFEPPEDADSSTDQSSALPPERVHLEQSTTCDQISIALLKAEDQAWNRYVESNPAASLYHRAEWRDLIHEAFGHECYYFYAHDNNGKIVGILPLVRLNSRFFGDFMVSMPYFNSGGAIANSLSIEQKLIQTANGHAKNIGSDHIEYRDSISRDGMPVRSEKVNMILSLPDTHEALWHSFTSKLRSQIRRAQREETQVIIGGAECLDDFYTVFAHNMRDLGTPVYGKSFFRKILQQFDEHGRIVIVSMGNRPVAAAFLLGYKKNLEIPWASTIKDVNHLSMNMLLYWEVLKFAIKNRYRYFDFGRSSKESGTFRFKQQWGAKPKQCYWHYWLQNGSEIPSLNPNNPKYKLLISLWKKIPVCITKYIGPGIVKNLP